MPKAAPALIFALCIPAVLAQAGIGAAQTAAKGGSNIALSDYPGPSCTKPQAPPQPQPPQDLNGQTASAAIGLKAQNDARAQEVYNARVGQYNKAVAIYNSAIKEFNACMQTYVDNGNADMARIKHRLDQAVAAANAR
ncbi:MAG TPA: hypothetical protein VNW15_10695 [Rhizomicrobium sp.]|jgi:hypothetical protein|nr:hypothetical protein [Rhizomicrobium sp.]